MHRFIHPHRSGIWIPCLVSLVCSSLWLAAVEPTLPVGVARVDITPEEPVRLSGYGGRRAESEGVAQRLWAKALAFGDAAPALLITVDNCGIPDAMRAELLRRLKLPSEQVAISFSHTHCGPCLKGALVNIFSSEVPPEHQARIDRYSALLLDKMEQVARAALADRKPALLSWAVGSARFARNRRAAWGGPVDHALPVMYVHSPAGTLRAVLANYACHATTLQFNQVHGDWPGSAMVKIEAGHPGAVALISIGCGADQNPHPRGTVELAEQHGAEIAAEVTRLLGGPRRALSGPVSFAEKTITLPLAPLPDRAEWERQATGTFAPAAYLARKNLARLARGESLPTELPYRVQRWSFGSSLAMLFFPGEITIDYQARLKTELDAARLWVNGYCNDALCYIPSERVLAEGGYEGAIAMVYYDRLAPFAPGIEEHIIRAAHDLVPEEFAAQVRADVPPRASAASLAAFHLADPALRVEMVATEPFVRDPVAIDWDAQGRLWVVEQPDYPDGMDGKGKPGGRVVVLLDTDRDTRPDRAELVHEGLPFPTGITCWGRGALVCAAPDIFYLEDTDGDWRADKVEKLYTGFYTDNYNARVNSLTLGLDGWLHGANGLLGGKIRSLKTGKEIDIAGRDFRIRPDTGEIELVAGVTQQGRARDDWDDWFSCSNSRWLYHFPISDREVARNPHVPAPRPTAYLPVEKNSAVLQPRSKPLERFNNPGSQGSVTSACGLGIYRDDLLGRDYAGDVFIGETAHNLVRRYHLQPAGGTFTARRPTAEKDREFLASEDHWCRPVQVRTGPDGALYIVDMYRAVIEHTRWIPADRVAKVDVRAGDMQGRIYRIVPVKGKLRAVPDLSTLGTPALIAALDTPNGTVRDLVQQRLLHHWQPAAAAPLATLVRQSKHSAVKAQAASILQNHQSLTDEAWNQLRTADDPRLRRHALRLRPAAALPDDPDATVRFQTALNTGQWSRVADLKDAWFRAAVLSASAQAPREALDRVLALPPATAARESQLLHGLITTAIAVDTNPAHYLPVLTRVAADSAPTTWQLHGLALLRGKNIPLTDAAQKMLASASRIAADETADTSLRQAALALLEPDAHLPLLQQLLRSAAMQKAVLSEFSRGRSAEIARAMLADWHTHVPSLRLQILTTLSSRDTWIEVLLDAVEKGTLRPADVPPAVRQALARNPRAARLLPVPDTTARQAIVDRYQRDIAPLTGHAAQGATVFKTVCATCHTHLSQGAAVGPDLKPYAPKPAADFLAAILHPNAAIEPRYTAYTVTTQDGRAITGVIQESATSVEIVMPGGVKETVLRSALKSIQPIGISLMPDGLEQALPPQAMADLIAYLKNGG